MNEKEALPAAEKNEIIVYQPEGGEFHIEVRVENETVWLTQAQMAELFSKSISVISRHISNVFAEHELEEKSNLHFLQIANSDKPVKLFSLDVIISLCDVPLKGANSALFFTFITIIKSIFIAIFYDNHSFCDNYCVYL